MISVQEKHLGGPFTLTLIPPSGVSERTARQVIEMAFHEVRRIENLLTDFRPSPLVELNQQARRGQAKVGPELFQLIAYALDVSRDSQGAFDITYASVGHLWREAFSTQVMPDPEKLREAHESVGFQGVVLDQARQEIRFAHPRMKIGLGGVGKGYAVDSAYALIKRMGFENFMVNGAGDIRVSSSPLAPRAWRVGIKNPFSPQDLGAGMLQIANGAVATSGDYERFMVVNGTRFHHVIDARTGACRDDLRSVSVLAPTALQADVYATATMALGVNEGC